MSTVTADFLECTPYTSEPTSTVFVTNYCVTLPAACPTSEWEATYTIFTTCTGDSAAWTAPACPPEFVETTVTCDVCEHQTQVITCPNAAATNIVVSGNGVTATAVAAAAASAGAGGAAAAAAAAASAGAGGAAAAAAAAASAGAGGAAAAAAASASAGAAAGAAAAAATAAASANATVHGSSPVTVVTAGAPLSMKKSLGLVAGLALIAGQFLML